MYLVDTNVLILGIKAREPEKSCLRKIISQKKLFLSVITVGEFLSQASGEEEIKFNELINKFPTLAVDLETAIIAASYRKKFLKEKRIQLLDCFLAAQAKNHKLTLVTNNKKDFLMKDIKVVCP